MADNAFNSGTYSDRLSDDIILNNVIGFNVKAWDPTANGGQGAYVDLGGGDRHVGLRRQRQRESQLAGVYDTWSTTYFGDQAHDGLDNGPSGANGIVDDDSEKTVPAALCRSAARHSGEDSGVRARQQADSRSHRGARLPAAVNGGADILVCQLACKGHGVDCRLSLRERNAAFAERKATFAACERLRQTCRISPGRQECLPHRRVNDACRVRGRLPSIRAGSANVRAPAVRRRRFRSPASFEASSPADRNRSSISARSRASFARSSEISISARHKRLCNCSSNCRSLSRSC